MNFAGLSLAGLRILAKVRQVNAQDQDDVPRLVHQLTRAEGLMERLRRKKRAVLGKIVSNLVGENDGPASPMEEPPDSAAAAPPDAAAAIAPRDSIKEAIEESGLLGGITNRIKRTADQYLNQKLDEIEARIDRKLDEIDRRLSEWRDREIANRLRILKITLWTSVIVGVVAVIYAWLKVYFFS
jgi:hypothetical protein